MHKQVIWEKRQDELLPLPVLPDPDGLVGWEKRLNLSKVKVFHEGLFILGNGKDSVPVATA
jgi:hypothetical protein